MVRISDDNEYKEKDECIKNRAAILFTHKSCIYFLIIKELLYLKYSFIIK